MTKWEYSILHLPDRGTMTWQEPGSAPSDRFKGVDLLTALGQLGTEGWELVLSQYGAFQWSYTFKRPLA